MPSGKMVKSLKKKYSSFFSDRRDIPEPEPEPELSSVEGTYPSLIEFKDSQEEIWCVRYSSHFLTFSLSLIKTYLETK